MPHTPVELYGEEKDTVLDIIRDSDSLLALKRAQSILLWSFGLTSFDIALVLGWGPGTVRNFRGLYKKHGSSCLTPHSRGGRRNAHLSFEREQALLKIFVSRARSTGVFDVGSLRAAYERAIDKKCALSTIYRLIHRHGFGNKLPRRRRVSHMRENPRNN